MSTLHSRFGISPKVFLSGTLMLAMLFLFAFLSSQSGLKTQAASGPGPGTCPNEYDSSFASLVVNNGTQSFSVNASKSTTFNALVNEGYNVSLVLQTAANSSQGNTHNGSVWLSSNTPGTDTSNCYAAGSVLPNESLSLGFNVKIAYSYIPNPNGQSYHWNSSGAGVSYLAYNVIWIEQTSTSISCYAQEDGTTICSTTVTGIQPGSSPFGAPNGTVVFSSSASQIGTCVLVNSNSSNLFSDTSSCSLSFTPSGPALMNITAIYGGDYDQSSSNATALNCCIPVITTTTSSGTSSNSSSSTSTSSHRSTTAISSSTTHTNSRSNSSDASRSQINTTEISNNETSSSQGFELNYIQSAAALVVSAVVIAGILSVAIRKSW